MKKTMKKVAVIGIKKAELIDVPIPEAKENWVLVKVHAIPLCTQYKGWLNGTSVSGHEAAGEVVKVPDEVRDTCNVKEGDRVVVMPQLPCGKCALCRAGEYIHCENTVNYQDFTNSDGSTDTQVQYLLKPDWLLVPIPDGVSYELASLACCGLGPTFGAMENIGVDAFDTVLITGGGPVGLGGVVNAKYRGAKVIMVESIKYRQEKAKELGADLVLDPDDKDIEEKIRKFTSEIGVDASLECAGSIKAQRLALNTTRRRGSIALVGECNDDLLIQASRDFIRTGIKLFGQWHYNLNGIDKIMQVIQESTVIEYLISHTFPMSEVQKAFEIDSEHQSAKIILKPWE